MCCEDRNKPLPPEELKALEEKLVELILFFEAGLLESPELTFEEEDLEATRQLFEDEYFKESNEIARSKDTSLIEKCLLDIELTAKWELKANQWELDSTREMIHRHWHKAHERLMMAQAM